MTMKHIERYLTVGAAILMFAGCAQTRGNSNPKAKAERVVVEGSMAEPFGACTRGILRGTVLRNWATQKGEAYVVGKGYMTEAPLPSNISPSYFIADQLKVRGKGAPDPKTYKIKDLGNELFLNLGTVTIPVEKSSSLIGMKDVDAHSVLKFVKDSSGGFYSIRLAKNDDGTYINAKEETGELPTGLVEPLPSSTDAAKAATAVGTGGLGNVRSLYIPELGAASAPPVMNLPPDVGAAATKPQITIGKVGDPLTISVVKADPVKDGTSSYFTVEVRKPSISPDWSAIYRVEDTGQDKIEIKSTKGMKGDKKGTVWVLVTRSKLMASEMTDGGGSFCTEAMVGALEQVKFAEDKAK
jgi:hypothetical protein